MAPGSPRTPMDGKPQTVALPVADIIRDRSQPRRTFALDRLGSLARSLLATGQISPIVVRPGPDGKYTIVVGERRWRAARDAGLSHIDCIIRNDIDDKKAYELQLAENYQREDVPPLEQATSFKNYLDTYKVSQSELSRRTGIPQRTISARLALLSLLLSMHARIEAGEIGPYEAIRIAALPTDQQEAVAEAVASGRIGGRTLEKLAHLIQADPQKPIRDIIKELAYLEAIPSSPHGTPDVPATDPGSAARDETDSDPEILELMKAVAQRKQERRLAGTQTPSATDILVAMAQHLSVRKRKPCQHLKHGVCSVWSWEAKDSVPQVMGDPVKDSQRWRVRPAHLLCALCTVDLDSRISVLEYACLGNPLSGARGFLDCDCGGQDSLAVAVKCTQCGRETWWGWFPGDGEKIPPHGA